MIRAQEIQAAMLGLVGWEQNFDTTNLKLSQTLVESESGLFFQQAHPLLTLSNLESIAPDFRNITYPEYSNEVHYSKGNIVTFKEKIFKAKQDSFNQQPGFAPEYWEETNPFSEWLESKTNASIQKMVSRFCNEKLGMGTGKAISENRVLFDGTGRITDTIPNQKNLVGFEIVPIRARGVTTKINKIGLQFTEPGKYTLYLMHSSMDAPVKIITLEKIRKNSIEWFTVDDIFLPYLSSDNDAGGSWYLCYFQTDLPKNSQAIRKNMDWSKGPCKDCSRREYTTWVAWSKYLEVHPFCVNEELVDGVNFSEDFNDDFIKPPIHMWDIENNLYHYNTNYGINLEVTVGCDITDFLITQRHLFVDVLQRQVAVDMLREFAYNPNVRANRHSINASRTDILYELDGDSSSMMKSGLNYQLDLAYKAISLSTAGLSRVCLPCKNNGIKYRVV